MICNLWKMGVYGGIPILIVLAGRRVLRRYPKEYSYSLWILVMVRLLFPVFIESPFCVQPLRYMDGKWKFLDIFFERAGADWKLTLVLLYLAGLILLAGCFLVQYIRTKQRVKLAVRETENIWRCEGITSAFVMGLIKPRIYLPYGLEGTERWYVVLHEKKHIRHKDPWIRALGTVTICLHWWNPLVWYAVYQMYEDMEMYCDESVIQECASLERKIYAEILLKLSVSQSCLSGLCFGESHTEQRIRNILTVKKKCHVWFVLLFYLILQLGVRISFTVPAAAKQQEEVLVPEAAEIKG